MIGAADGRGIFARRVPCSAQVTRRPPGMCRPTTRRRLKSARPSSPTTRSRQPQDQGCRRKRGHVDAFNVTRTYINITGNINHYIAFRITPTSRAKPKVSTAATSIAGNYVFRLKYGFVQFNLDDHLNRGRTGSDSASECSKHPGSITWKGSIATGSRADFLRAGRLPLLIGHRRVVSLQLRAPLRRGSYRLLQW